jgi:predicted ATPase
MRIGEIGVSGYRSLRAIRFPVGRLTVFVGANGVGKTNLYRALELLQAAAAGTSRTSWHPRAAWNRRYGAGKRMANKPAPMKLAVGLGGPNGHAQDELDDGTEADIAYSYDIDVGVRMPTAVLNPP